MDDLISRQAAIYAIEKRMDDITCEEFAEGMSEAITEISLLPSAEPEVSRIERELHGKTPEEQYEFLYWLLLKFGLTYTDSRLAVIEWLRGEQNERGHDQQTSGD